MHDDPLYSHCAVTDVALHRMNLASSERDGREQGIVRTGSSVHGPIRSNREWSTDLLDIVDAQVHVNEQESIARPWQTDWSHLDPDGTKRSALAANAVDVETMRVMMTAVGVRSAVLV